MDRGKYGKCTLIQKNKRICTRYAAGCHGYQADNRQ